MTRLFFNLAVYLGDLQTRGDWSPGDPHSSAGVRKPVKLGREVKISPHLRALSHSAAPFDPQWRLQSRHVVRGHWRNQPFGPGRQERRRQWIEPFWKGPAEGERLDRAYRLTDQETPAP